MKTIQKGFLPGDRWLYFKVYTGQKTADDLLIEYISPLVKKLLRYKLINQWFFIRYTDPDFHLRIRFELKETQQLGEVVPLFYDTIRKCYPLLIYKIDISTYKRELGRYLDGHIITAEKFFHTDSNRVISILKKIQGKPEDYRWKAALLLIDDLLTHVNFSNSSKLILLERMSENFKEEFGYNEYNRKQLNGKYRNYRPQITDVLQKSCNDSVIRKIRLELKKSVDEMKEISNEMKNLPKEGLSHYINSLIHMCMNRLFMTRYRLYELVIYDFLYRYYKGVEAQQKYNNPLKQ